MGSANSDVISTLNNLIEVCKNGENGYQTAAKCVTNVDLKALFQSYSTQRGQYAAELQSEVMRLGGTPETHGSLTAPMWRAWTNIKSLLSGGDEHAVIEECERGEDSVRDCYQNALTHKLPPHIQALLERQFAAVKEAHDRIHALETVTSKS